MSNFVENVRNRKNNASGFTLLELMVVVGLLAILGLLSTSFDTSSWLANHRLKGAARDLFSNMQKARMNAIKENRNWSVAFNKANNTYQLQFSDDGGTTWVASPDPVVNLRNAYKSGVCYGFGNATAGVPGAGLADEITFGSYRVIFNPRGLPNTSGYCYLTNDKNDAYAIGALTSGAIKMRKWNRTAWQ